MDNSTAVGKTNLTIVPRKTKSMDLRLWWLRCHEAQEQFCFYWDKGSCNLADYHTKHHPPIYHESNRPKHVGAATQQLRDILRAYAHTANRPPSSALFGSTRSCNNSTTASVICCPIQAPLRSPTNEPTSMPGFFLSLSEHNLGVAARVYCSPTYGMRIHEACRSGLAYPIT